MQRSHRLGVAALAVGLVLLSGACSSNSSNNGYNPNPVNPPPGLELNSGNINGGGHYVHTFANAGAYAYKCTIHSTMASMHDTIFVNASAAGTTAAVSITGSSFTPKKSAIKPGGTVTWTNNDGFAHTVTSE